MRDHSPVLFEEFNGLYQRGSFDAVPADHFSECQNIQFTESGFRTRDGLDTYLANNLGLGDVVRMYTFVQESGQSILVLDSNANIYDVQGASVLGPILHVDGMTDFGFVSIAGRAYLTPCDGITGLEDEFVYVYQGDGTPARKAAGAAPTTAEGALAAANGAAGHVQAGVHIFAAVYETNTGFLTALGPTVFPTVTAGGSTKVNLTNIPVSALSHVDRVHIVATKTIPTALYTGNTEGYQFFFIPEASVTNGTTTLTVDFYDIELLEDASHLIDILSEIPASVGLNTFHNRMISYAEFGDDLSLCRVSYPSEPEAMDAIDGFVVFPLDGKPITNGQEYRDTLYLFKQTKTSAWTDNGDSPANWPMSLIDQGIGCSVHGMGLVLDAGGANIEFLIITDYSGIMLFNGFFSRPELTYKIQDLWLALDRDVFEEMQLLNDTIRQIIYVATMERTILYGDYSNGMSAKSIKWAPWIFDVEVNTIALINTNTLLIGSSAVLV